MERQFNTDCEGPISKNDNAFELAQQFIPQGGEFFAKLSKYDDFLADIVKKPGYKAGDTLRLILPFFKAYGLTDAIIKDFSSKNILLVPGADVALKYTKNIMPSFIISTSYRPYINALCKVIDFPTENTYCTELNIDRYKIPRSEIEYLKKLHDEILDLPPIEIPSSAVAREDLPESALVCISRLDKIFWEELPDMASGKMLDEVNPIGGFEKAEAIKKSVKKTGFELSGVMYAGDSITDAEAMKLVENSGGITVSFNGNRYAIKAAQVACMSPNALILATLACKFKQDGTEGIITLASNWEWEKAAFENSMRSELPGFSAEGVSLFLTKNTNLEDLITQSESFRKKVRGERVGQLG
jgi:energy-converting hydrogenase A subunit R